MAAAIALNTQVRAEIVVRGELGGLPAAGCHTVQGLRDREDINGKHGREAGCREPTAPVGAFREQSDFPLCSVGVLKNVTAEFDFVKQRIGRCCDVVDKLLQPLGGMRHQRTSFSRMTIGPL